MKDSQTLENTGILINRLKEDSDFLRTHRGLLNIGKELRMLNNALSSVPIMAEEMRQMNVKMGVMTYGVDSTMGRMGRMVPWW